MPALWARVAHNCVDPGHEVAALGVAGLFVVHGFVDRAFPDDLVGVDRRSTDVVFRILVRQRSGGDFFCANVARFMEPTPPYTYGLGMVGTASGSENTTRQNRNRGETRRSTKDQVGRGGGAWAALPPESIGFTPRNAFAHVMTRYDML